MTNSNRRDFLKRSIATIAGLTLPISQIELAFADKTQNFTFAYISDSHIQHIKGSKFVRNFDRGLIRAVAETNLMNPKPDFVVYGGDLAQLGKKEEIDHGLELMSALRYDKVHYVIGEHDYYLDLGKYWQEKIGPLNYSFDHKGVHFVILNSILTYDEWTHKRWPTAEERMAQMAGLDNPNGSPFMVGDAQRKWLRQDLSKINKNTPIVVFSHSPLQKIYKGWNFWTEDADQVQGLLKKFDQVNVIYGHVHQIQYNQIRNIAFTSVMSTAWPWPYPESYAQAESHLPILTVPMNRADPFDERDATGWQFMNMHSGRVDLEFNLYSNENRSIAFNHDKGHPEDTMHADPANRNRAQSHY